MATEEHVKTVYLVCGVSGSGKSWVCRQLADKFNYIPHDRCWSHATAKPAEGLDPKWGPPGSKSTHLESLLSEIAKSDRPVISEIPFGERKMREDLEAKGIKVVPIFVIEQPWTVAERYFKREGKSLHQAAMTRASSIKDRAKEWGAFSGTSDQVLKHLKDLDISDLISPKRWLEVNAK